MGKEFQMPTRRTGLRWFFRIYKIYTLAEDFVWESQHPIPKTLYFYDENDKLRMVIDKKGKITVKERYTWDGCTPKFSVFDLFIFGTPDGIRFRLTDKPKTYYASLVHDALYQFLPEMDESHGITRRDADDIFRDILIKYEFAPNWIYWLAVRAFGWIAIPIRKNLTRNTNGKVETSPRRKKESRRS